MEDILDRIDKFLEKYDRSQSDYQFICKKSALRIVDIIKEEVSEDAIFLDMLTEEISNDWGLYNNELLGKYYKVLKYYGILEGEDHKKTILDVKGKTIVRKFVDLSKHSEITELLEDKL